MRSKKTGSRKSDPGKTRKENIVDAAIECLGEEGLGEFSFTNLSERTGASRSLINYYFPNQQAVIEAAVTRVVQFGQEYTDSGLKGVRRKSEQIGCYIAVTFRWFDEHPHHASVMLLILYLCTFSKKYLNLQDQVNKDATERLAEMLTEMTKSKRKTQLISKTASELRQLLVGALLHHHTSKGSLLDDAIEQTIDAAEDLVRSRFSEI